MGLPLLLSEESFVTFCHISLDRLEGHVEAATHVFLPRRLGQRVKCNLRDSKSGVKAERDLPEVREFERDDACITRMNQARRCDAQSLTRPGGTGRDDSLKIGRQLDPFQRGHQREHPRMQEEFLTEWHLIAFVLLSLGLLRCVIARRSAIAGKPSRINVGQAASPHQQEHVSQSQVN